MHEIYKERIGVGILYFRMESVRSDCILNEGRPGTIKINSTDIQCGKELYAY